MTAKGMEASLAGVVLIRPDVFEDARGFFMETWSEARSRRSSLPRSFAQDNLSFSRRGVLRGLHLQNPSQQGKLIHVLQGEIFDVVVDVRANSPTFGKWLGYTLRAAEHTLIYVPEGFAHGFCVTSETALVAYKCTRVYDPEAELCVSWNDPDIAIAWPVERPILSERDARAPRLKEIDVARLPRLGEE